MIEESVSPSGVHIAGNFQAWIPGDSPMTDEGGGIWTFTESFQAGEYLEFKYINGNNWGPDESVPGECNANNNRFHTVGESDEVLDIVCFGACENCDVTPVPGCIDPTACNYNASATEDDGSCSYDCLSGCTDASACNYDSSAVLDDGSCDYSCLGCTDASACNFDSNATINDGSCDYSCYGCTDAAACNYDETASIDDGSCEYGCTAGCIDDDAVNYNAGATFDDGSCEYEVSITVDMSDQTVGPSGVHIAGSFQGWDPAVTLMSDNGDGTWTYDFNSAPGEVLFKFINGDDWPQQEFVVGGCAVDDGFGGTNRSLDVIDAPVTYGVVCFASCVECETSSDIPGCTYSLASNYNAEATIEDGSCLFGPQFCGLNTYWDEDLQLCLSSLGCMGDLNADLVINAGDLLIFLAEFGTDCEE
jgi:hypothetical protein